MKDASDYHVANPGAGTTLNSAGTNYDISGWSGLYYINGDAGIHGTVNHLLTIVSLSGTLSITGPIKLTNANSAFPAGSRLALPSLGVIASGDIVINPGATTLDAYLFSNGTIDTCATQATYAPAGCGNTLVVDGFLMAHSINFKRLGPDNTLGGQNGEQIALNPQIYLNPPQFFDGAAEGIQVEGQGERQPLY